MPMESFEEEIRKLFDEKLVEKAKNLKKTRHIFSPFFYILFTRLVELSALINDVFLPEKYELEELFKTRKSFLQIDYGTLGETIRRAWLFERKRGMEFTFSSNVEDLLYVLYRMGKLQSDIDRIILKYAEWDKDKLVELYFTLIRVLLELEDEINRKIDSEARSRAF